MATKGNKENIQLGPGNVYIKPYCKDDYSIKPEDYTELGWTGEKGAILSYKGDSLDVKSGNHLGIVKTFLTGEEGSLEFSLQEITLAHLVLPHGYDSMKISDFKFLIGNDSVPHYFTVLFESTLDTGLKALIVLFQCQFERNCKLEIAHDKVLEIPCKIIALNDETETAATADKLGWIMFEYTPAP